MNDDITERARARLTTLPLDGLGVSELQAYVMELQGEIARAHAMIERKRDHLGAAEQVFGRPGAGDDE